MNKIQLNESTTNYNEFTRSELTNMTPDQQVYRSMKGHYKFVRGEMTASRTVKSFHLGELHINRIPSLGLARRGPLSWISGGLHIVVDGESHQWYARWIESVRNNVVDIAEASYYVRGAYVY